MKNLLGAAVAGAAMSLPRTRSRTSAAARAGGQLCVLTCHREIEAANAGGLVGPSAAAKTEGVGERVRIEVSRS